MFREKTLGQLKNHTFKILCFRAQSLGSIMDILTFKISYFRAEKAKAGVPEKWQVKVLAEVVVVVAKESRKYI